MKLKQTQGNETARKIAESEVRRLEENPDSKNWNFIMQDYDINPRTNRILYNGESDYSTKNSTSLTFDAAKCYELNFADDVKVEGWVDFKLAVYGKPQKLEFCTGAELDSHEIDRKPLETFSKGKFVKGSVYELAYSIYSVGLKAGTRYEFAHSFIDDGRVFLPHVTDVKEKNIEIEPRSLQLFLTNIRKNYCSLKAYQDVENIRAKQRGNVAWSLDQILEFLENIKVNSLELQELEGIKLGISSCALWLGTTRTLNRRSYSTAKDLIEKVLRKKKYSLFKTP